MADPNKSKGSGKPKGSRENTPKATTPSKSKGSPSTRASASPRASPEPSTSRSNVTKPGSRSRQNSSSSTASGTEKSKRGRPLSALLSPGTQRRRNTLSRTPPRAPSLRGGSGTPEPQSESPSIQPKGKGKGSGKETTGGRQAHLVQGDPTKIRKHDNERETNKEKLDAQRRAKTLVSPPPSDLTNPFNPSVPGSYGNVRPGSSRGISPFHDNQPYPPPPPPGSSS